MAEQLSELIRSFGFTAKETEAFITILHDGPMTVQEVVDASNISRRHAYNAIDKLEAFNFVVVNDYITPTTVEPAPPDEVREQLQTMVDQLYNRLEERYHRDHYSTETVKILKSRSTVIATMKEMISSAQRRVGISIPAQLFSTVQETLVDAIDNDVATMLLLTDYDEETELESDPPMEETADVIRYSADPGLILLAVDRDFGLVAPTKITSDSSSHRNALYSSQPHLVSVVFTTLMEYQWQIGQEYYVTAPQSLPTTYSNIRKAVIDATLQLKDGVDIAAEIDARPVDEPEAAVTISGEVVEVGQRLIEPITATIPHQSCLYIDNGGETVTVGGTNAYLEDYRARSIRITRL
ncbi:hypothetical protein Hrd1104_06740 [Halorhabdus sp. CBA1104]|uniref:TrmB family transcriptional regulator sugar-binding domain-containing protein n=1 Tax=unclassified Halorhabdus TaxID=2621901 RepID=UPI0012B231A3|nr:MULTISPECIES: TrmB family transcriptional regulator sugar-binding domain-containing protein [unclassified Halorhabdus]QGN07021.1 hypothetical protein Hrd1104_06740 [Halorhabdus sp. CBA1104]